MSRMDTPVVLRISLLASYTIDPLVPYLGMALHEAELPARFHVGPFDQIMRQCLDDAGETAGSRPDILVVVPRFEELGPAGPQWTSDLLDLAGAALGTVGRWAGCLVFVLPALPESRAFGAADAAEAVRAREAVRTRFSGLPNVYVADVEDAIRTVGGRHAHHPVMFRLGRVPYTEELFACLAGQLARLLGARHGVGHRLVVLDADSLLGDDAAAAALHEPLRELHRAGTRIAFRSAAEPGAVWTMLASRLGELVEFTEESIVDGRPVAEQIGAIAAALDVAPEHVVLMTADTALATGRAVLLGEQPESWAAELRDAGLFDRPAPPPSTPDAARPVPAETAAVPAARSLADFVASLDVRVSFQPAQAHLEKVAEVVERAKDFTLGIRHTAADIAGRVAEVLAVSVRDRFGDYDISGAVGLRLAGGVCTVDLFSLSCPVLGKEVEDAVLREILRRAGNADIVFRFERTEHNDVAVAFVRSAAEAWPTVRAVPSGEPEPTTAPVRTEPVVPFGIVAFGHSLPEPTDVDAAATEYTADLDRVRGWEYRRFHRAAEGVGLTDLAVAAGERALAAAGLEASEVDLVVLAIADLAEYLYWDPAAATQARLGAHGAEAVLVNQACGGGVAAFDIVAGKFAAHPAYRTALVIGANRVCEPYWNRMEINTSIYSDGAAPPPLRRDHGTCRWLATEIITDGSYADFMRMEVGGAARPFTSAGAAQPPRVRSPFDRLDDFFDGDVRRMFSFVSSIRARSREVVDAACARAGVSREDIKRVIHFNDNAKQLAELASDLGIPVDRTNIGMALEHAHVGCADQLLTLEHLLATGELAAGDLVALTSTGSGMHWICTLLRV